MKRTERIGVIVKTLSDTPGKLYPLQYFCDLFQMAKSSISEDINIAASAMEATGSGFIETISGARGGVHFVPDTTQEAVAPLLDELCDRLRDPARILGGGFLYTSDIMYDTELVSRLATLFAVKFRALDVDYVATVETKGIPLATMVAHQLHRPLIICRREAKVSEGSTVSINYFSGSYDRVQKMSLSRRAVRPGSRTLVIDDFMRGGGSTKGIADLLAEFDAEVVGAGIAIVSETPEQKKIRDYTAAVYLGDVDEEKRTIDVRPNPDIFK
ncbi:pur operon repressor [Hornefia porci]|uniref:Pur operon repressor n=1 Tax=Hornefia porci TaxID=2652292 RepID=A0A1Q9JEU1_9FIRM|nr:pur operon repressor [Hornefia porci]OLR54750.1 pur operon repressor [Hornefia porci]